MKKPLVLRFINYKKIRDEQAARIAQLEAELYELKNIHNKFTQDGQVNAHSHINQELLNVKDNFEKQSQGRQSSDHKLPEEKTKKKMVLVDFEAIVADNRSRITQLEDEIAKLKNYNQEDRLKREEGKLNEKKERLNIQLKTSTSPAMSYRYLALAYIKDGDIAEAKNSFEEALQLNPIIFEDFGIVKTEDYTPTIHQLIAAQKTNALVTSKEDTNAIQKPDSNVATPILSLVTTGIFSASAQEKGSSDTAQSQQVIHHSMETADKGQVNFVETQTVTPTL